LGASEQKCGKVRVIVRLKNSTFHPASTHTQKRIGGSRAIFMKQLNMSLAER